MPQDMYEVLDEQFDAQDDGDPFYVPTQEREIRHDD